MNLKSEKKKIAVELIGGTGNQLFQLVACAVMAKNLDRTPLFSDRILDGNRNLEVLMVANKLGIKKIDKNEIRDWPILKEENIIHPSYFCAYPKTDFLPDKNIVLSGYFQNYRMHQKNIIDPIRILAKDTCLKSHKPDEDFIAIHTRELQASNNQKPLKGIDNLSIEYYIRALELAKNDTSKKNKKIKKVYLFTDMFKKDTYSNILPILKKHLQSEKYEIVLGDKLCTTAWGSISIMSQANYIILSSSTFSWWAGYLSKAFVICPILSLWETRLMTPDNWIQVNDDNLSPKSWHRENIYKKQKINLLQSKLKSRFRRKIEHILFFYILKKTPYTKYKKYLNLKRRNLLS